MFEPENELERSLVRAAAEPAYGPAFLRRMFNGTTFVPLEYEGPPPTINAEGKLKFPAGTRLTLRTVRVGDQSYLPFFTAASRARATTKGKFVIAPNVTREIFERHPGKQFVLNPGLEHSQTFSSDAINRLLAGHFDDVDALPTAAPAAVAKPSAVDPPPAAKGVEFKPVASESDARKPAAPEKPAAAKPTGLDMPIATGPVFAEETFVFKPIVPQPAAAPTAKPAALKPPGPGKPTPSPVPENARGKAAEPRAVSSEAAAPSSAPMAAADDERGAPRSAPTDQTRAAEPETKALAAKADAAIAASAPPLAPAERPKPIRAAASETLAAWRRMTAKRFASDRAQPAEASPDITPIGTSNPAVHDGPVAGDAPVAPGLVVAKAAAPDSIAPPPLAPPSHAAARSASLPSPSETIRKPDPYPVEVLLALTLVFQRAHAIEAAFIGQAQIPGRPAHLVVALTTSESWDSLMETLGSTLRKALPPASSAVEFTPFPGGLFEDYFRSEAQPFFKKG